jgi:3'-phosphoadenosine 5'-phosphosulfate sulfotransferase (PAPS reductase)/FAD synthetase
VYNENWNYWEKYFLEYSKTDIYIKQLKKTKDIIKEFIVKFGLFKLYVSCSGGKDSIVLAHICNNLFPGIKVFSEKDIFDFPEEKEYLKSFNFNLYIAKPYMNFTDLSKFDFLDEIHSRSSDFSKNYFYSIISSFKKEYKYKGVFLGLRTQESKGRLWNFKKNGFIYYNKRDDDYVCQPLALWKTENIFAYLISNKIAILNCYKQLKFIGDPRKIRKSWYLPGARATNGQASWLKYYYPALFNNLLKIDNRIKSYV